MSTTARSNAYDVVVLGSGASGLCAALAAADAGAAVAVKARAAGRVIQARVSSQMSTCHARRPRRYSTGAMPTITTVWPACTSDRAKSDLEWADLVLVWGATELHHKVSGHYTHGPPAHHHKVMRVSTDTPEAPESDKTPAAALPVLPLRDVVVYPHMVIPLFVGREKSIEALESAMAGDKQILLGISPGRINTLHVFDEPVLPDAAANTPSGQTEFARKLQELLGKGAR